MTFFQRNLFAYTGPWGVLVELRISALMLPAFFVIIGILTGSIGSMLVVAVLFVLSIYLHELGHAWACVVQGVRVERVVLNALGGYCAHDGAVTNPQKELIVAMGPLVNLAIWAAAGLISALGWSEGVTHLLWIIGVVNLGLALFNLLPMMPRDGAKLVLLVLTRMTSERAAMRATGALGLVTGLMWLPAFLYCLAAYDFVLLFWPPYGLHWRMLRHGDFGTPYSPVRRRFWQWRRRPEGPWDRGTPLAPAE